MKIEFSREIIEKYSKCKFNENPSGGSRVVASGRTNSRFLQFCEREKNELYIEPFVI